MALSGNTQKTTVFGLYAHGLLPNESGVHSQRYS